MQQGRWISYIYKYKDNVRFKNVGFVKVQKLADNDFEKARIQIGLKNPMSYDVDYDVFLVKENQAFYVDRFRVCKNENDTIVKRLELPWNDCINKGQAISEYDGLLLKAESFYVGMWKEDVIDIAQINVIYQENEISENETSEKNKDEKSKAEQTDKDKKTVEEKTIEEASATLTSEATDICEYMIEKYPPLENIYNDVYIKCVRIEPNDIGLLPIENWSFAVNSFLSHGYYRYKYVMLGKAVIDDDEKYVLGVPGIYSNKEKYLANMFGFKLFVPIDSGGLMTGKFGYWLSEISR